MTRFAVVGVGFGMLLATTPMDAHHSFAAQYDGNRPVTLRGTISRMLWSNPHGHLYIDVKMPDGKIVNWELETGAPGALYRRGWKKTDLPVGREVIVKGYLAKDGTANANATAIVFADTGQELFAGSSGTGAPVEPPGEGGSQPR